MRPAPGRPAPPIADPVSKQSLLLVDGDPRSLRVLEVSLKKAGFNVTTAVNGRDALDKVALAPPDLVIAETQLDEVDGFAFCQKLKSESAWADIPFVFLTAQTDIATKIRGLELGVDDYLTKPIYIKEIVARARILLQKRQRTRIEERRDGRTRFAGHLSDMPIVDLIQTVEISRKSGLIQFIGEGGKQAAIYFRDGKVIDAEAGPLQAEDAVYRLLTWNEGEFEVAFRTVRRRDTITMSPQALLMEGMRRLDEWGRLCEQLPPLETRFEIDARELTNRLGEIQDEHNAILRLFDGRRSVLEVIDACDYGDLESLEVIARLYFEGVLVEAGPTKPTMSGEWMVPTAAIEAATAAAPTTGLVSEDGDEDDGNAERPAVARTVSGEWTLGADDADGDGPPPSDPDAADTPAIIVATAPPSLPRTLTPLQRAAVLPSLPPLPTIAAPVTAAPVVPPARRSLIQKAIDDSDAIAVRELEEELGRQIDPARLRPVVRPVAAATRAAPAAGGMAGDEPLTSAEVEGALAVLGASSSEEPEGTAGSASSSSSEPVAATPEPAAAVSEPEPLAAAPAPAADPEPTGSPKKITPPGGATALDGARLGGRPRGRPRGGATLVTDPPPPSRAPAGTQPIPVERTAPAPRKAGAPAAAAESEPPNRRGARWPAVVTGVLVVAGLGYAVIRLGRPKAPRSPVAGLIVDGGAGAVRPPPPPVPDARIAAPIAIDAGAATPTDAAVIAHDAAAPRPAIDAGSAAADELKRKLDAARKLIAVDPQQALDQLDVILDEQRSARALILRADALDRLGRNDAALSAIGAALAMAPRSAAGWELKGKILWAMGRREEGRAAYVRFLELQPTGPGAEAARRLLGGP